MSRERREPIIATFNRRRDNTYELNQVITLEDPTPGTIGALCGGIRYYDVDWSHTFGCYLFHNSGAGGSLPIEIDGPYWSRRKQDVEETPSRLVSMREPEPLWDALQSRTQRLRAWNRTRRLFEIPFGLEGCADIMEFLEFAGIEEESVWCGACRDHLPADELCKHCWWCDSVGWYVTPDEGEICFDPDCWGCSRRRRARHEAYRNKKRLERWRSKHDMGVTSEILAGNGGTE